MHDRSLTLIVLHESFAVCRLDGDAPLPSWSSASAFSSITRTAEELSVVCHETVVAGGVRCEGGWRCLRVAGTIPFATVGVVSSLTVPLAAAGISVFAISTFDTDYLFVKEATLVEAMHRLREAGHVVRVA